MDYRQGVCTGCQNSFRVPATFVQNKAKCPKCGGVVEIGPVQSGGAPAAPAAAPASPSPAAPIAAAERTAPTPAAGPAAQVPAKVPAPKPVAPKPTAPTPAPAKPVAALPSTPKPAAAAPAKPVAAKPTVAKPAAAKPAAPAAAKPSVRASAEAAAKKVKAGKDSHEDDGKKRRGSGGHGRKKQSAAPLMVGAIALLAIGGGAGWYFLVKLPGDAERAQTEAAAAEDARRAALLGHGNVNAAEKGDATSPSDESSTDSGAETTSDSRNETTAKTEDAPVKAAEKPAKSTEIVDDIDLLALPELGKFKDSTDEEWTEIVGLARTLTDLNAGARGGRAGTRLEEIGRPAVPALLNELRKLDFATTDGFRVGDMIQKRLERICNGRNFGWNYWSEGDDQQVILKAVVYDKKAVRSWFTTWEKVGEDDDQWLGFTKQLVKPAEDGGAAPEKPKDGAPSLDDF